MPISIVSFELFGLSLYPPVFTSLSIEIHSYLDYSLHMGFSPDNLGSHTQTVIQHPTFCRDRTNLGLVFPPEIAVIWPVHSAHPELCLSIFTVARSFMFPARCGTTATSSYSPTAVLPRLGFQPHWDRFVLQTNCKIGINHFSQLHLSTCVRIC